MRHLPKIYTYLPLLALIMQMGAGPSFGAEADSQAEHHPDRQGRAEPPRERNVNGPRGNGRSEQAQERPEHHSERREPRPESHPQPGRDRRERIEPERGENRGAERFRESVRPELRHPVEAPRRVEPRRVERSPERGDLHPNRANVRPDRVQAPPSRVSSRTEPARTTRAYPTQVPSRQESRTWWDRGGWRNGAWQPHSAWRDHRTSRWEADHRTWSQRGGYGGYCIPRAQFQGWFGTQHWFRIPSRPVIYQGYPRFWYRNYWFFIVDPWPDFWGEDWYLDDDVYIDYTIDGYYLFSRRHPGVSLAVAVSL